MQAAIYMARSISYELVGKANANQFWQNSFLVSFPIYLSELKKEVSGLIIM